MYGIIVVLIYAVIMVGATLVCTRRETTAEGFLVGNRNIGVGKSALSIAATWIWAPALFVSAEQAFTHGIPGLFWFLVPNVLCLFLFIPFAKRIRQQMPEGITLSGYMADKYQSKKVKGVYLFQLGALSLLSTAVQLLAGGKILSAITGLPLWVMTIVLAVIAFSYSQFSGLKASILTDAVQMVFMLAVSVGFVFFALKGDGLQNLIHGFGGFSGEYHGLFSGKGVEVFLGFGLPTAIGLISGPFGDQCFWQRAFAVRKTHIGKAFAIGGVLFAVVPLSMGMLGYIAAGSGMPVADASVVNFELITRLFPAWAVVPFLFMVVSGLLSTIDSNLCATASLTSDVQQTYNVKTSKIAMLVLLAVAIGIANLPRLTVTHLFLFYGTFRASTLLPTIMTLKGINLTGHGVVAGVVAALLIGFPIFAVGNLFGLAVYKTIGSLMTVLLSGIIAVAISRKGAAAC